MPGGQEKIVLRSQLRALAERLPLEREERDTAVVRHLLPVVRALRGPVGAYANLPSEPNLTKLYSLLALDWAFPRVEGQGLVFYRCEPSQLSPGAFGVPEPQGHPSHRVELETLSAVLVPALGFDRHGRRLGRGKGFYDRALSGFRGLKIGVGYTEFVLNHDLPQEDHDISMDWIVTDQFVMNPHLQFKEFI